MKPRMSLSKIVELAVALAKEHPATKDLEADEAEIELFIQRMMQMEHTNLFTAYEGDELVGFMLAHKTDFELFKNYPVAKEMLWYVKPCNNRVKHWFALLDELTEWAKEGKVCDAVYVGCYTERLAPIYEKMGLKPFNWSYYKEI